jgi:hypothetical protein
LLNPGVIGDPLQIERPPFPHQFRREKNGDGRNRNHPAPRRHPGRSHGLPSSFDREN